MSKKRWSIRNPRSIRRGAGRNAMNISKRIDVDLVGHKKSEIINLIRDLYHGKAINHFRTTRSSNRSVYFEVGIAGKSVELQFFIWTDNLKPENQTRANFAKFFLKTHENIREKVLDYLEGIEKGHTTEYLGMMILEELNREPIEARRFKYFRKATPNEDRYEGKDFVVFAISDGREIEIPIQFKSSKEELMKHKEEFSNVPGLFREFKDNRNTEMDIIKEKIIRIIEAFKRNEIIFI